MQASEQVASSGLIGTIIASTIGIGGAIISWLMGDARSKTRLVFAEERMKLIETQLDASSKLHNEAQIAEARSAQDRLEIHRSVDRLDESKASKEMVQNFKEEINLMRADMKAGFGKLESLVLGRWGNGGGQHSSSSSHHSRDDGE